jgi:ABC-type branched-subunit amino acid transport system substrate-binding protein
MSLIKRCLALLLAVMAPAAIAAASADQGVTDREIIIAQTAGFTGAVAGGVTEMTNGAKLYFDAVNANGGIGGRKIVLGSLDDKFDPKLSAENARKLIADKPPLAFFGVRGTPNTEAVAAVIKDAGIPLIAPSTGAAIFHQPVNPLIFNVRAKYQTEIEQAISHLSTVGITRIAAVYAEDSFGKDGLEGFNRKMAELHLKPLAVIGYDRTLTSMEKPAAEAVKANPQALLLISSGKNAIDMVARVRKAGGTMQFVAISNNSAKSFVKDLGPYARGVLVTQVFPNPANSSLPIAREMQKLAHAKPDVVLSQAAMEGFAGAKVLVEGLRRAGKVPTRASLIAALDGLKDYDLGGINVSYSPTDHTGTEYAEMSIIDAHGEFMQ